MVRSSRDEPNRRSDDPSFTTLCETGIKPIYPEPNADIDSAKHAKALADMTLAKATWSNASEAEPSHVGLLDEIAIPKLVTSRAARRASRHEMLKISTEKSRRVRSLSVSGLSACAESKITAALSVSTLPNVTSEWLK